MKKRYQIDKQRAVQQFRRLAEQDDRAIQLVIPLKEVLDLVQRGLMNLALRTFTQVAEEVMDQEVTALVGPKSQASPLRPFWSATRWNSQRSTTLPNWMRVSPQLMQRSPPHCRTPTHCRLSPLRPPGGGSSCSRKTCASTRGRR